ncbi:Gfo/Idh/MocA family oxidoreductase [bacterium]|nr:Gfo/Idh/MocA family oxidoreductase [bacterium]
MQPVTILVIGAGGRGAGYARFALEHPDRLRVVGVAEPRDFYRERLAREHGLSADRVFRDWREVADRARLADAVMVTTQDAMHADPAVALAANGYQMLLEKPMAPNEPDCVRIVGAVRQAGILFAVCHVMRYTAYTRRLKAMLDAGAIGEIVSVQHLEPVGYWHIAHSFVRGSWRNEAESSPLLLSKSCHDLDWLRHIVGRRCVAASSFGTRQHFRREAMPANAAERCLDCGCEPECPYSAKRFYFDRLNRGQHEWPLNVITTELTPAGVEAALRTGPYGRCVYACDNDVVDHQVVNLLFDGGATATFTMNGFNEGAGRQTRLFGTRGQIETDSRYIHHYDFLTEKTETIDTKAGDQTILGGHGGGDYGLMDAFVSAVAENDPGKILSGPEETLESHCLVFAAERARRENTVVLL